MLWFFIILKNDAEQQQYCLRGVVGWERLMEDLYFSLNWTSILARKLKKLAYPKPVRLINLILLLIPSVGPFETV